MSAPSDDRVVVLWVRPAGYGEPVPVLARYYAEPWEQPASDLDPEWAVYDEEHDIFLCPAGWYEERATYGDDCAPDMYVPAAEVLGWCEVPLPEVPK